ncbi:hypothetical protein [Chondrinema litorale]|uniref:hypothetical protein n=1 Tax=Chondrinema litorale TaxID=2994555 RepID=UPI00254322BC|nr:hypothetical protein [Chondrinema litorale]UZR93285.1 hypothetical protein OQ292_15620 [Chondrinema litorale]
MQKGFHKYVYEFIVVVAGITISLFFDGVAEDLKKGKQEKYYLQNLLSNLADDSVKLSSAIGFINEVDRSSTVLLKQNLEKPASKVAAEEIANCHTNLLMHTVFASNNSVFEELKSTGAFETIKNKNLKNDLFRYYGNVNAAKENDLSADNTIVSYVYPCLNKQVQLSKMAVLNANFSFMFKDVDKAKIALPKFEALSENQNDYLNAIIVRKGINSAQLTMYQNLMKKITSLKKEITEELAKK